MPSEIRHLMFRPYEVALAVQGYHRRMNKPLPPGALVACKLEGEGEGERIQVRMTIMPDGGKHARHLLIDGPTLAASLILYCQAIRIPLPSKAEKSLQRFGDQVCLVAKLNAKPEAQP